ncbi:unnamed protein product [Camellia sinensis]
MVVNTPIHTIMTWTMLILMFILDMSIHILLNMHFLERSFYRFARLGPESLRKRKTGSGAGKENISDAPNGSTHHIKSVVEKELSHSPSNLVFGYLNLFSDDGFGKCFLLYGLVGGWSRTLFLLAHELPQEALVMGQDQGQSSLIERFTAGGFVYIAIVKVLGKINSGSNSTIKSIVLQLTSLISGMAVTLCISLAE